MASLRLPPAPPQLTSVTGQALFGMYEGAIPRLDWSPLALSRPSGVKRTLRRKRWLYAALTHESFFLGMAVVDVGWTSAAFVYVFDFESGQVIDSLSFDGLPFLPVELTDEAFGSARFEKGKSAIAFERNGTSLELVVRSATLNLAASMDLSMAPPVLASVAPANLAAHATLKTSAIACAGRLEAAGREWRFQQASASLDHSSGLLARHTEWRWASAHRPGLGLNLQQGYMGDAENALWLDGVLYRLPAARFDYDTANPLHPWSVTTVDGGVDLTFHPCGARHENRDFIIAASRYVQPVGYFQGTIRHPETGDIRVIENLAGVTEDHLARW